MSLSSDERKYQAAQSTIYQDEYGTPQSSESISDDKSVLLPIRRPINKRQGHGVKRSGFTTGVKIEAEPEEVEEIQSLDPDDNVPAPVRQRESRSYADIPWLTRPTLQSWGLRSILRFLILYEVYLGDMIFSRVLGMQNPFSSDPAPEDEEMLSWNELTGFCGNGEWDDEDEDGGEGEDTVVPEINVLEDERQDKASPSKAYLVL